MLRGINVSGQKKIKMDALKALYQSLGFSNIQTYIQSGNVVFESEITEQQVLTNKIETKLQEVYGYAVTVILRTPDEFQQIMANNPLAEESQEAGKTFYVTFLLNAPEQWPADEIEKAKAPSDKIVITGKEIYFYCPGGYGKTKLSNNFLERKLKVAATTRNWNTVNKLLDMAT